MIGLLPKDFSDQLISFSPKKQLAFLVLLYDRMSPELYSFCLTEGRDSWIFQKAREEYWRSFIDISSSVSWANLREDILNSTPDSEEFGSQAASFALNAALTAADIAGFLADGLESHIFTATGYALNSLSAYVIDKMEITVYDKTVSDIVKIHPLVQKEAWTEKEDVAFLSAIQDPPWPANIYSIVRHRTETQQCLLS